MNMLLVLVLIPLGVLGLLSLLGVIVLIGLKLYVIIEKAMEPPTEKHGYYTLDQEREVEPHQKK